MHKLRVGTRKSLLSRKQTDMAIEALQKAHPELDVEIVPFQTRGDTILDKPLWELSNKGKGVFASEFEEMILRDEIDIAIHSGKDLPVFLAEGLQIIGVLKRDDPRDVLVMAKGRSVEEVNTIGTGSLRRQQCAEEIFPWAECYIDCASGHDLPRVSLHSASHVPCVSYALPQGACFPVRPSLFADLSVQ